MVVQNLEIKPLNNFLCCVHSSLKPVVLKKPEFYPTEWHMQEMQRENITNSIYTFLCLPLKLSTLVDVYNLHKVEIQ